MKLSLTSEVKESFLILAFCFLMREYLTYATIGGVCLGAFLVVSKLRPNKFVRNALALGIFGSYWLSYGKVIDPEVGLNFLTTVTVLKLLEKETLRDRFMLFFGFLLIISAGSLFEKTLSYVLFFCFAFFVLIQDFYQNIGARWKVGELLKALFWVLPLTGFLFFLAPRAMSPLPFNQAAPEAGEVGYTSNVNISQVESLNGNANPVFEVQMSRRIPQEFLYWRGNTVTFTDGWNWLLLNKSYPHHAENVTGELQAQGEEILQSFRSISREDHYFTLDYPIRVQTKGRTFLMKGKRNFPQGRHDWSPRYMATSLMGGRFSLEEPPETYLRVPLKPLQKKWIESTFPGTTPQEVLRQVRDYFIKNQFTYSLAPGRVESFREFMTEKKIGFCSHYASALGLILRVKKIPARLVSGFMGGEYNQYADFYQISQNDAHVWVEVLDKNKWVRVDPTAWMAPTRITLGGEGYMATSNGKIQFNLLRQFGWYNDLRQWFSQWDFVVYQWLENMDYQFQERWIQKLKLRREWVYSFAVLSLVFFMGLYAWTLKRASDRRKTTLEQQLWQLYLEKVEARGLSFLPISLADTRQAIQDLGHEDSETLLKVWDKLVRLSFAQSNEQESRELLAELKRL